MEQSVQRVENHVVAIVDGRPVIEDAAPADQNGRNPTAAAATGLAALDLPGGVISGGRRDPVGTSRQLHAAQQVVDAELLDALDVVGQRADWIDVLVGFVVSGLFDVDGQTR
jgi:hypothetical protein